MLGLQSGIVNSPVNTLLILAAFLFMLAASCQRDTVTADETFKDSSSVSVSTREETSESSQNSSSNVMSTEFDPIDPVVPFTDMSAKILGDGSGLWNFLPGVVIFDYDRDGDMDIFLTQMGGYPNLLYISFRLGLLLRLRVCSVHLHHFRFFRMY